MITIRKGSFVYTFTNMFMDYIYLRIYIWIDTYTHPIASLPAQNFSVELHYKYIMMIIMMVTIIMIMMVTIIMIMMVMMIIMIM
jgi:hypothetical protein